MMLRIIVVAFLLWVIYLKNGGARRTKKSFPVPDRSVLDGNSLLLIMLDGFRPDYVPNGGREKYPNFHKLFFDGGAVVDYVQPIFPSVSFPSWTTIGTGLYAESHGILHNVFYDRNREIHFHMGEVATSSDYTDDPEFYKGHKPLWISAKEAGMKTSLYKWHRCNVPFTEKQLTPDKCLDYDNGVHFDKFQERMQGAIQDLKDGYRLVMVYYGNPDQNEHDYGVESVEVEQSLKEIDDELGKLDAALTEAGMKDQVNIAIMGDHGHVSWTDDNLSVTPSVAEYISVDQIEYVSNDNPFVTVVLKDPSLAEEAVKNVSKMEGVMAFSKASMPDHYHWRDHPLVPDVIVVSKGDAFISGSLDGKPPHRKAGIHGFDDTSPVADGYKEGPYPDMRTSFLTTGPSFKVGHKNQWIKLVDEYNVFCYVLGITPEPNNGTWDRVRHMLKDNGKTGL